MKKLLFLLFPFLLLVPSVLAHCPLCTIGAAAAAGGAAYFGVSQIIIGLFTGAFAVSIGWWISRLIKKKYIPLQRTAIVLFSFATTIFPLMPLLTDMKPYYLSWFGDYGSLFNRTYLINMFLVGSIIGGIVVCFTPWLSDKISKMRGNRTLPFQGTALTLIILAIISLIIQFAL